MTAKLDRSKPYGEVHGENVTHRFEQDHKCFDQEGNEIGKASTAKAEAPAKGKASTAKADADSQVDAQMAG